MSSEDPASFHAFMIEQRAALVSGIYADMAAEIEMMRSVPEADRWRSMESSVDVIIDALLEHRPSVIDRLAESRVAARVEQGLSSEDMLHGVTIIRRHLVRHARAAIEERMPGAFAGMELLLVACDELGASVAGAFQGRLDAAQKALTETEERYRTLYLRTPAMMHSIDLGGHIVAVSDLWLETLGYSREEVMGRRSTEFMTAESYRYSTEVVLPTFFKGEGIVHDVNYQFVTKGGDVRDILLSATFDRDASGKPVGALAVLVDVTERRKMEQALRESEVQAEVIRMQEASIQALSTPLIPVGDRVVVMPLVGNINEARAGRILEALLAGVTEHRASFAILDVTGVPEVNETVAQALIHAAGAVRLLGAQAVLTGIQPKVAQALVQMGVDLGGIVTRNTLQSAIAYALGREHVDRPARAAR
jgi:PAS domain S-box-containing protein